jgi:8-oxo-dGTP diphosphatase
MQEVRVASTDDPRVVVRDHVRAVSPLDDREAADQADILGWIESGAPLFRTAKPATPPRHLAVYAALVDEAERSVMLVDHRKAQLWLLPGGHVDDGEDPRWSVEREAFEELGISPKFHEKISQPCFLSVTQTRGAGSHTDVTLWFVLEGDSSAEVRPDLGEFSEVRWLSLDRTDWSEPCFDPHMDRFVRKLSSALETGSQR